MKTRRAGIVLRLDLRLDSDLIAEDFIGQKIGGLALIC